MREVINIVGIIVTGMCSIGFSLWALVWIGYALPWPAGI